MEEEKIIRMLNKTDKILLSAIEKEDMFSSEIELKYALERAAVINSARKLFSLGLVKIDNITANKLRLTPLGQKYLKEGLPEYRVFDFLKRNETVEYKQLFYSIPMEKNELNASIGVLKKMLAINVEGGKITVNTDKLEKVEEQNEVLQAVEKEQNVNYDGIADLIRRGIIEQASEIREKFSITQLGIKILKNSEFTVEYVDKLSPGNIKNWNGLKFREYSEKPEIFDSLSGNLNVKTKFISLIKDAMISMGFSEMHSNYVESTFWNFDVMMFRQDHPDRDIQDTVYLNGGKATIPAKLIKEVKNVYEHGFFSSRYNESIGYRRTFDKFKSDSLIMRGHTTATTFRYIYEFISKNKDKPAKFFSVDKGFRNETMDNTHLLELYQIEGVVYDDNLTVSDLIGYIKQFYKKIGIENIRLKPTYNPYTEPSLEIQAFSPKLKRWLEVGNSGVFRPETLKPFGINKNIVAWGFGMERMLNLKLGMADIRDLYGAYTDLDLLRQIESARVFGEF
ncbi:MAG: phenylalanine--tRNA ligase subunit alpha [Candidatus Parvarchaeota archaeon]|nr:phenylalanine--tRNA ligase subunit alpha [Candidatus Parvarchaeota archaeon]MCL5106802.1 phenylalanine--tRNA ligase subunit alpha [Candidatus Parvarchaeota archaeon]